MIDPIKPIGAFIENTIRPLIEELHWFFDECEKRKLAINERNIKAVIDYIVRCHFRTVVAQCLQNVILALIIGVIWTISLS